MFIYFIIIKNKYYKKNRYHLIKHLPFTDNRKFRNAISINLTFIILIFFSLLAKNKNNLIWVTWFEGV